MKKSIKYLFIGVLAFFTILLQSCGVNSLTDEELISVIENFEQAAIYKSYTVEGELNFFNMDNADYSSEIYDDKKFTDAIDKYSRDCSSYLIGLPLHITLDNWTYTTEGQKLPEDTRYNIEAKIIRISSTDKVRYEKRADGGLIVIAENINKQLKIKSPNEVSCYAKYNYRIEYNSEGYLELESFETINTNGKNNMDKCFYGQVTYTYA